MVSAVLMPKTPETPAEHIEFAREEARQAAHTSQRPLTL
ncbi:gp89 [Mycobacterium phage Fruitloop]|uniref:Uncharacterized protein n=1 Tax=Mycobacterium phage Fruitloop TaxID=2914018 RepID=B5U4T8_9CAUD|nr:gp89 [Mycobacterium phage Fruitloop]ACI12400.1 hypothetical protein FRUITLOOP_89 [Mycobacterium phage Fruitloop]